MSVLGVLRNASIFFVGPVVLFLLLVLLIALVKTKLAGGRTRDQNLPNHTSDYRSRGELGYGSAPHAATCDFKRRIA